jgi:hypothetical protein
LRRVDWHPSPGAQSAEQTAAAKAQVERREFEYIRHGTQSAIVSFDVARGQVLHAAIGQTRTEQDFVGHIRQTVASDPNASWVFVVDQLNIHQSLGLVDLVAELCQLTDQVEERKAQGLLKAMVNRAMFLSDPTHRISFVYTAKHTSWLNQIEIWFSILVRRVIKRGSFTSVGDLRARILAFIEYFNQSAKPFKWTFTGRPLVV